VDVLWDVIEAVIVGPIGILAAYQPRCNIAFTMYTMCTLNAEHFIAAAAETRQPEIFYSFIIGFALCRLAVRNCNSRVHSHLLLSPFNAQSCQNGNVE